MTSSGSRRSSGFLFGICGLALICSACSSASTSPTTTTLTSPDAHSACNLVTQDEIRATLNKSVNPAREATEANGTRCVYAAGSPADSVIITFESRVTADDFARRQAALSARLGGTTDLSGSGFSAYTFTSTAADAQVTSLITLIGGTQVGVTSSATLDQEEALTKKIYASLATSASSNPAAASSTTAVSTPPRPAGVAP